MYGGKYRNMTISQFLLNLVVMPNNEFLKISLYYYKVKNNILLYAEIKYHRKRNFSGGWLLTKQFVGN